MVYLNKYLAGDIYLNYYIDAIAGIIASTISAPIFKYFGLKKAFITSYIVTLIGLLGLFLYYSNLV